MTPRPWHKGNAGVDGAERRGWLVGHFIEDPDDIRATNDVEIKWGVHPAGDQRPTPVTDESRTTVILLVRGRFCLELPDDSILLENEGDYVMLGSRRRPLLASRRGLGGDHRPLAIATELAALRSLWTWRPRKQIDRDLPWPVDYV